NKSTECFNWIDQTWTSAVFEGRSHTSTCFNAVIMYDVITGRSQMFPCMKHKRRGYTAVLTGNVVVVMGGINENSEYLKSVECFDLELHVWQHLPDMLEPRAYATAVVKPNL
ncbi:T9SS C-terminal target domain-containing, partial [Paramuricea clavata]